MKRKTLTVTFYAHAGSHNHGCEAIVRSTAEMLRATASEKNMSLRVLLVSGRASSDEKYKLSDGGIIEIIPASKMSDAYRRLWYYIDGGLCKFFGGTVLLSRHNRALIGAAEKSDLVISIGGDNYSENNAVLLSRTDALARRYCKKSVLWGASLDERWLDPAKNRIKLENLAAFSLITARESVTYDTLVSRNLANVRLFPDPAFTLPTDTGVPELFPESNTVGINISPLIQAFQNDSDIIGENYAALVRYILGETDMHIALIPHVTWCDGPSDLDAIDYLLSLVTDCDKSRIHRVGDMNCMRLKGYISRCRFFVCARTHASIAAYSTCVPTLVAGYSVKAKGIARDIFGTDEGYVVPVQSLVTGDDLTNAFKALAERENEVRERLSSVMPAYIERARSAAAALVECAGV